MLGTVSEKLAKREIRNRSANSGRSPWILDFIMGPVANWIPLIIFPDINPIVAVVIECGLIYVIGYAIINKGKR